MQNEGVDVHLVLQRAILDHRELPSPSSGLGDLYANYIVSS